MKLNKITLLSLAVLSFSSASSLEAKKISCPDVSELNVSVNPHNDLSWSAHPSEPWRSWAGVTFPRPHPHPHVTFDHAHVRHMSTEDHHWDDLLCYYDVTEATGMIEVISTDYQGCTVEGDTFTCD